MNEKTKTQEEWREYAVSKTGRKRYMVSNTGLIKIIDTKLNTERITEGRLNRHTGYLTQGVLYSQVPVHSLVMKMFGPPKPRNGQYMEIHHKDSNKHNNSIENLMWISRREHGKSAHKIEMLKQHRVCTSHKNEVLRGEKDGVVKFWENGPTAARDIGCTSVLVYNATNKKQSARRAYGWELAWIKRDDVPKGAIIQAKRKRSRRAW